MSHKKHKNTVALDICCEVLRAVKQKKFWELFAFLTRVEKIDTNLNSVYQI